MPPAPSGPNDAEEGLILKEPLASHVGWKRVCLAPVGAGIARPYRLSLRSFLGSCIALPFWSLPDPRFTRLS